jgi:hypothetical protein
MIEGENMQQELWMVVTVIAVSIVWVLIAPTVLPVLDRATLRAGLWINGIDGRHADEIIAWHEHKQMCD